MSAVVAVAIAACGDASDSQPLGTLAITAPTDHATVSRDYLTGPGAWVAPVGFKADANVPGATTLEWVADGKTQGISAAPDWTFAAQLGADGSHVYEAVARDGNGVELARAQVTVVVAPPTAANGTCQDKLKSLGQAFTAGPATMGIADPVTITMPMNGIPTTAVGASSPRKTWLMDCNLALSIWRMTDDMKKAGLVSMVDYGIYNYRCIDQTVQPPCPGSSLSMHALGLAIDLYSVTSHDGTVYTVLTDFVIDTVLAGQNTCTAAWKPGDKNIFLHTLLCELAGDHVYNIFLTPNYNADHRNHFHMDLTPRSTVDVHKRAEADVDVGALDDL
jgi:hypothetical protein